MPGTQELADGLRPLVHKHDAILMEHHGVVTCGHELLKAYFNMESVEHCAKISLVARQLGPTHPIPVEEVRKLMEARQSYEANKVPVSVEWD
jgi:L-fuculose-phosphate aldolase